MKRIAAWLTVIFTAVLFSAHAQQDADNQYLNLYGTIQQGDELAKAGNLRPALVKYTEAQEQLQQFQRVFPDWNTKIVTFRLRYLAGKISDLAAQLPAPAVTNAAPVIAPVIPVAPTPTLPSPPAAPVPDVSAAELASARAQLESVQAQNVALLAKLKEALSVQPAPADADELAKAQAQVQSLMKENDLLKTSTASNHTAMVVDTNSLMRAQTALNEANQKLAALEMSATNAAVMSQSELNQTRAQITALQSAAQAKESEKAALQNRIQQLEFAKTNAVPPPPANDQTNNEARIQDLTQERDDLLAKLGAANQQLYGAKKTELAAQVDQLADQIRTLRERLAVAESAPVPYTAEELALLRQSAPQLATGESQKKSVKELPAGSAGLVAEAQSFFNAGQFERAEADYLKVLQQDEKNALVLGNLAAIEMQEGKLDSAEKHIKVAITQDPNDAFNISTLGYLKFRQEKFDEALDLLSRAAKLDPQNPEIQNYLGVTLSHKGLRTEAETALRKSIQINPNYAAAHNNLAAIYVNQTPPMLELARWHYQKALDAGLPHNPELEKALAEKSAPPAAP